MSSTESRQCDVGLIGLAVMGQNLALNLADHGYRVAVYNRTASVTQQFVAEHESGPFGEGGGVVGMSDLAAFVQSLDTPRVIIVLVKAGPAVDAVCEQLIDAGVAADDIVVDAGNSLWTDTIEREAKYRGRLTFFGSGVSGGEVGARFGPSLMPGGDGSAWRRLEPIWRSIAAKIDPATGKPIEGAAPGRPVPGGEPCTAYIGPNGAGHYVKMVHNGIEYADMQLIAEAYDLLRRGAGLAPERLAAVFDEWNTGELDSFLIEITADILRQRDPQGDRPFVDIVLDAAGQKGTGRWTAEHALELGVPATTIAQAVFARAMSALKDERIAAAHALAGPTESLADAGEDFVKAVRDALYCAKIAAYAQGFQLMAAAQKAYDWSLDFGSIARIWRGGCIIRAVFLQKIADAFESTPDLANLMLDPHFAGEIGRRQQAWRYVVATAARLGIPAPGFSSALGYYDGYRSAVLPANLIQAQRDYFGAHTYERVDRPRGERFHLDWPHPDRPEHPA
jgi:6-phosphogluconate dehydrogenase